MIEFNSFLLNASFWILPLIIAIPMHEAAHAIVAKYFGDETAYKLKRATLNPCKHIDPIGTILLPAILIFIGAPFIFGYAKPVPINIANLKNPKKDMIWIALAGPFTNAILAILGAILLSLVLLIPGDVGDWLRVTVFLIIHINIVLLVFNLLPILPLDGGRIMIGILPQNFSRIFSYTERYGFLILIVLIFALPLLGEQIGIELSPLTWVIMPIIGFLESFLLDLFAIR